MGIDLDRILVHSGGIVLDTDFGALPLDGAAASELVARMLDGGVREGDGPEAAALSDLFERAGLNRQESDSDRTKRSGKAMQVALSGSAPWASGLRDNLIGAGVDIVDPDQACGLIVVVADIGDPEAHLRCARRARCWNAPLLHGSLAPHEITLGPLFRPGLGACWSCARDRRIANDVHAEAAFRLDRHRRTQPLVKEYSRSAGRIAADLMTVEIMRILQKGAERLLGRMWIFNLSALKAVDHLVVPLPDCEVCGGAAAIADPTPYRLDIGVIADAATPMADFPGWVDPTTGVVNDVWVEGPNETGGLCFALARTAFPPTAGEPPASLDLSGGKGLTRGEAIRGALGEALERYSAAQVSRAAVIEATMDELDGPVMSPEVLGLYSSEQYARSDFPFERFDPGRRYHWITGESLADGAPIWLPAETTLFSPRGLGDRLCQVTTNGLALGRDREDAAMRAVLELVERDGAMMCWLGRLPSRRLLPDLSDEAVRAVLRYLEPLGVAVSFHLAEVGTAIPTVIACSLGDGARWPGLCVGSAAHPSPKAALRAAGLEMAATGRGLVRAVDTRVAEDSTPLRWFADHAQYYMDPARAAAASFLLDRTEVCSIPPDASLPNNVYELGAVLAGAGVGVVIADVTPSDVALSGMRVVRAVSDGLLPIHCGTGLERRGSRRLANLTDLNVDPHPFC
jgi:ribosomal protein S12 methylthiotransferase accessory factor